MSKQPLGKTLLRNVIRHTDAHNKIQEEMEMWKMRGWEMQTSHPKHTLDTDSLRGHMHCDRVSDQSRDTSQSRERGSEQNDKEARYWTRKLYEFEAGDPDRWGHSGFKELYPEDFESGGEELGDLRKSGHHKTKKSKSVKESSLSKRSKKSSRKKKKKKSKKSESKKLKKDESSSSELCSDDSSAAKDKQKKRKRTKSRHKNKKTSKTRERDEDSSSGDGKVEERRVKRNHRCKKRKQDSHTDSDSGAYSRKKRKDWKAAGEENSADTSAD